MTSDTQNDALISEASDWLAYLYSGDATDEGEARFKAWIRADRAHEAAFRQVNAAFEALDQLDDIEQQLPAPSARVVPIAAAVDKQHTPWAVWVAGVVAVAAALLVTVYLPQGTEPGLADTRLYETGVGEVKTVSLPDGSVVTLGANSALSARFTGEERDAELVRGRAYFDIARDEARRFDIAVGETEVRVLGTAFDIRKGPEDVRVSVTEGLVEVVDRQPASDVETPPVWLRPGEQVAADLSGNMGETVSFNPADALSWREGRLSYADAKLADIVADARRYHRGEIRFGDAAIADLRITTSFRTNRLDELFAGLDAMGAIRVDRRPRGLIVLADPGDAFEEEE